MYQYVCVCVSVCVCRLVVWSFSFGVLPILFVLFGGHAMA